MLRDGMEGGWCGPGGPDRLFEPSRAQKRVYRRALGPWAEEEGARPCEWSRLPSGFDLNCWIVRVRAGAGAGSVAIATDDLRAVRLDGPDSVLEILESWKPGSDAASAGAWVRFVLDPDALRGSPWRLAETEDHILSGSGAGVHEREALRWHARRLGRIERSGEGWTWDAAVVEGRRLLRGPLLLRLDGRISTKGMHIAAELRNAAGRLDF